MTKNPTKNTQKNSSSSIRRAGVRLRAIKSSIERHRKEMMRGGVRKLEREGGSKGREKPFKCCQDGEFICIHTFVTIWHPIFQL